MTLRFLTRAAFLLASLYLAACAVQFDREPARFEAVAGTQPVLRSANLVRFVFDTRFDGVIHQGSRWQLAGRIAQGDVYQPVGNVFTIQGSHQHEARLVMQKDRLVGFYLPYDSTFVPQSTQVFVKFDP